MTHVVCRSLTKILPSGGRPLTILDDIDLEIGRGEFCAILGRSGSGKSTLLGLIAGLDRCTAGEIRIGDLSVTEADENELALMRRGWIGFVFQSFQLLENLTARENVGLPLELIGRKDARERTTRMLAAVGLEGRGHHYPAQLSGGEQQRVALARAFAPEPELLLADEPTGNLDPITGAQVLEQLLELRRSRGTTLVLVTHDEAIAALADRVVRLDAGRVVSDRENPR